MICLQLCCGCDCLRSSLSLFFLSLSTPSLCFDGPLKAYGGKFNKKEARFCFGLHARHESSRVAKPSRAEDNLVSGGRSFKCNPWRRFKAGELSSRVLSWQRTVESGASPAYTRPPKAHNTFLARRLCQLRAVLVLVRVCVCFGVCVHSNIRHELLKAMWKMENF